MTENKRYNAKLDCKHLLYCEEGHYCMEISCWFLDFEGYEDYCPNCEHYEKRSYKKIHENRFDYTAYDDGTSSIYDRIDDEYYFDMDLSKLEELLNKLHDENEQLKLEIQKLKNNTK